MDERLSELLGNLEQREPPAATTVDTLVQAAAVHGVELPSAHLDFMRRSDGGEGDVGETWLELWSVARILNQAEDAEHPYEEVFLFAGDGANTIYCFDARNASEITEGDWIGLGRDELIAHGRSFLSFLESLAAAS
jgi:hypothetical protein